MSRHISDELPSLLTGDATRDVVLEAAAHLRDCVDCQQELVSAVVAHASLTSAHRFAPEIVPPGDTARTATAPAPLPDLGDLFAEARSGAAATDPGPERSAPKHRLRLVGVAAAAAVVLGGGVTWAVVDSGSNGPAGVQVALDGVSDRTDAQAVVVGDRMRVDASSLPVLTGGRQYEVWLSDGQQRQSLGFLKNDRSADLAVPETVMARYDMIAVSVQRDGQTEFSGNVVLSGDYS